MEQSLKRQYFKAGRTGNVELLRSITEQVLNYQVDPYKCKFSCLIVEDIAINKDPEQRNLLTLALLNAHAGLLAAVVEIFAQTNSEAESQQAPHDIVKSIFDQTYDGLPCFVMALSLHPFKPFRQRSERTLELLCDLAGG